MSKHPKADLYLRERKNGMTYRQIAEKHGVSYQSVHCTCTRQDGTYHTAITPKGCIYPNLRAWLNNDAGRRDRFFREMKHCTIRDFLKGIRQPKKGTIDKMLELTGMTYEVLFKEEDHGQE